MELAPRPQPMPRQRRGNQRQGEQAGADGPSHPGARPRANLVHDELLAAAHLAVGLEKRGEARDAEVVEGALAAALALLVIERIGGDAVALRIGAGVGEGRLLGAAEIERCAATGTGVPPRR